MKDLLYHVLVGLGAIYLVGMVMVIYYLYTSKEGYEDETGFHEGKEPPLK